MGFFDGMWSTTSTPGLQRKDTKEERRLFFAGAPTTSSGRLLLADRRAPFEHFWPRNLLLSTFHAVAFTAAPALAAATPGPDADDEDDLLDWDRLGEELKDFKSRAVAMFVRVLGCTSLKRCLEAACVKLCKLPTADKLLKDAAKSAQRKAARYGRWRAACRMVSTMAASNFCEGEETNASRRAQVETAAYANCLSYAANLLVEEACFIAAYVRGARAEPAAEPALRKRLRAQSTAACVGYGAAFGLATLGAAAGSLLKPGWGTIIGGACGDLLGILLI